MNVWGLAASAGMEAQVKALADALGLDAQMKDVEVKPPFVWLPNKLYAAGLDRFVIPHFLTNDSDALRAPWPDMVISCGRRPAMAALGLKHVILSKAKDLHKVGDSSASPQNDRKTKFIHIQDPHISSKHFDVVVAMQHDRIEGDNVIKTQFALHNITREKLAAAQAKFQPIFSSYPPPYIAVLLGGSTNKYTLSFTAMQKLIARLRALQAATSGTLLITVSRRTGDDNARMLKAVFGDNQRVHIYDGIGENPYMGMLALAECIFVTNDSVNMMSEAAATGRPLYILPLAGHRDSKPARFADGLIASGVARNWAGTWEQWNYTMGDEMPRLAGEIRQRLKLP